MKVIVDCDTGNDDAWAIISLLRSEKMLRSYEVIALTCVHGNTSVENSALNNLLVLETLDRLDIPVFKGAETGFIKNKISIVPFHGLDGFGMIYDKKPSKELIQKKHAVLAIKDLIDEHSDDVTIITLGPLTNIALLFKMFPGISSKIKSFYLMGGNHLGIGNITKCAEFNFWNDPEAAQIFFEEVKCSVYIFPLEPCVTAGLSLPLNEWRFKVLSSNNNPYTNLLDRVEAKAYGSRNWDIWTPWDNFLVSCFILPRLMKKVTNKFVTVELSGNHTRGQMIIDHQKKEKPNAFIIEEIDVEEFKKFMLWVCEHDVPDFNIKILKMKVIIDCDSGNDDAWAIITLLRAEQKFNFKVLALTCVDGNTTIDHSAVNNLLILKTLDRLDVPVYKGADSSFIKKHTQHESFHGPDGFGMIYNNKPSDELIQKKHAVLAIKEFIDQNPNDLSIIAIGPLTNIALLFKLYPETASMIKGLHIMGGNHKGVGNITKCAEFNFWSDPEAAHIVLAEANCPIYIFPWDPSRLASESTPFDEWRIMKLSNNNNPYTNLLDPIEIKAYRNILAHWCPCDCYLASCFILPRLIKKMNNCHVTVELSGYHTRGQMIIDHQKKEKPNAFVIEEIDVEEFKKFMLWVCEHPDSDFE
ncbi:CLUMA_CG017889, isoform A [Clunio marinus]|uniref:CLUMA_CG017889, isoform A n=1 Tax=Clunio marinus TaxID=568069 RepID=A0A1J1IZ69_9DIPT|nr:CLUMA_CG017889, isoform A [Clunio marinus]